MTPAEARQIDREEFAAECKAVRERALVYAEQHRDRERRKINLYLGLPEDTPTLNTRPVMQIATKHVIDGRARTFAEWACVLGLTHSALHARLRKLGSIEAAVAMGPLRPRGRQPLVIEHDGFRRTIKEWAKLIGVEVTTIHSRLRKGWPVAEAVTNPTGTRHSRPGVSPNFAPIEGTGAGSTVQETPNITFSGKVENA